MALQVLVSEEKDLSEQVVESLLFGRPLKRREDFRLVTGRGTFVDDMKIPKMLHSAVVRSHYAHALIKKIDTRRMWGANGVRLVLTGNDLPKDCNLPTVETDSGIKIPRPVLATTEVSYVGEPIAFVVADTLYQAEDALELVEVEYEPLPLIIDPAEAAKEDSPKAHESIKSNIVIVSRIQNGDIEEAFKTADKVISLDLMNQRLAPSPIETRVCLASYYPGADLLTVWISTQSPFDARSSLANIIGIPENKIRVVAPEVGGGFGAKISTYSEEVLVSIAAKRLCLPVKWVETRSENMQNMTQGRGQLQHVEIAANNNGRLSGLKVKIIGDAGAYLTEGSSEAVFTIKMAPGSYIVPAYYGEAEIVLTNKVPHGAYRGASWPEATYMIERAVDELARVLNLDPSEVRFKNLIRKEDFPYNSIANITYDTGDYSMNLKKALEISNYNRTREEQRKARNQGRIIGIGICTYVEMSAFGPDFPQSSSILVTSSGKVNVISGTSPHGQGHETPFAQLVADELGIPLNEINVTFGDTSQLPWGSVTAGSRSGAIGGTAVMMSAKKIKNKMALIAANIFQVPIEDIVFKNCELYPKSNRNDIRKKLTFQQTASFAYKPKSLPMGMEPVLFAFSAYAPPNYTFPFGTHIAVVEIERETGNLYLLNYTCVDDCGRVINPLVVQGQIHGAVAQGLGQALLESIRYDNEGQLLTATFLDYLIPKAGDIPDLHCYRTETPTYANPMGVKGIGEAGTIAATPALANAVADALAPYGSNLTEMPFSPDYLKLKLARKS